MASYPPPNQNVAIFNPLNFITGGEGLTLDEGKKFFLQFPDAQGTENMETTNIDGVFTANDQSFFNDKITLEQTDTGEDALNILVNSPGYAIRATTRTDPTTNTQITILPTATNGEINSIVQLGDALIYSTTGNLTGANLSITSLGAVEDFGVRLNTEDDIIEVGGLLELMTNDGLKFFDGTTQNTAYTGTGLEDLNQVLLQGNDAMGQNITNLNDISTLTINGSSFPTPTPAINSVLTAGGNANFQSINNLSSIATAVAGVATRLSQLLPSQLLLFYEDAIYKSSIQGLNPTTSASPPTFTISNENKSTGDINTTNILPNSLQYTGVSKYDFVSNVGIQLSSNASSWLFNTDGSILFPDSTIQTTAYTGTGLEDLNQVLIQGNDAMGQNINGVDNIDLNTITGVSELNANIGLNIVVNNDVSPLNWYFDPGGILYFPDSSTQDTAYTGVPSLSDVLMIGNDAMGQIITDVASITFSTNNVILGNGAGGFATQSICIGINAGSNCFNATCIGNSAGGNIGTNSVAIGTNASATNGSANSICIVGDGVALNPTTPGLFISPIRNGTTTETLYYDTTNKEIFYGAGGTSSAIPTFYRYAKNSSQNISSGIITAILWDSPISVGTNGMTLNPLTGLITNSSGVPMLINASATATFSSAGSTFNVAIIIEDYLTGFNLSAQFNPSNVGLNTSNTTTAGFILPSGGQFRINVSQNSGGIINAGGILTQLSFTATP